MKWEELLSLVAREALFTSAFLLAGRVSEAQVRLQLSRWVKSGRLLQLRRGLYSLAPPWRKVDPHPFLIANAIQRGSYVSVQSALGFHGIIPEYVPVVTSVGPGPPETLRSPLGSFQFNHLAGSFLFGYSRVEIASGQFAFVACPEKALLDLVYLTPGADSVEYLRELRLQNPGTFDPAALAELALRSRKPKLIRASRVAVSLLADEEGAAL